MSELETEYEGQIDFTIVQTAGQEEESGVEDYGVGNHGLVAFDGSGAVVQTIPGHDLDREQIVSVCEELVQD